MRGFLCNIGSPIEVVSYSVLLLRRRSSMLAAVRIVELTCGGPDLLWWVVVVLSRFSASRSSPSVGKFGVVKVGGGDAILP
ncbi:hypothetical protein A2U01_0052602 [Trifolium medium]|uniref:Uncharacterized protein n=1 Tax=Trifolium medium TaxID=97028 RepID=A0A392R6I1_9FABA|nr:hypothetical protein [Trifolium medium]